MTTARTRLLALLGHPVAHSRSPAIHTAALEAMGVDARYLAFAVAPDALGHAVDGLRAMGALGANVTVPHKRTVMAHLDAIEPAARAIGAVNTLVREGERWVGANTDAPGLVRSLEEAGVTLDGARVWVVGAGGAARAAVAGLAEAGAGSIRVQARRAAQAAELVEDLAPLAGERLSHGPLTGAPPADLLVQATSATLESAADPEGFAAALPLQALAPGATVVDLVYAPLETAALRRARQLGLRTVDGLGMLVWQAALALARWTGAEPPIDVMRAAALGDR